MREHNTTGSSLIDTFMVCDAKIELFGSGDNQIENKLRWRTTSIIIIPKLTSFRTLLDELLYYQKIDPAADRRPGWSFGESFLHKSEMQTSLSHKSPQRTRAAGVPRSKLVPRAEHATCMSLIPLRMPMLHKSRPRPQLPLLRNRICIVKLPQVHRRVIHIVFRPQGHIRWGVFS